MVLSIFTTKYILYKGGTVKPLILWCIYLLNFILYWYLVKQRGMILNVTSGHILGTFMKVIPFNGKLWQWSLGAEMIMKE